RARPSGLSPPAGGRPRRSAASASSASTGPACRCCIAGATSRTAPSSSRAPRAPGSSPCRSDEERSRAMKVRLCLALLALIGPLAFAPAPLPRQDRRAQAPEITLATLQGRWRVTSHQTARANGQLVLDNGGASHILIFEDCWTFLAGDLYVPPLYIRVDSARKPARLNFYDRKGPNQPISGVGLIRRHGPGVQVVCRWGGEQDRPVTFDLPPEGAWLVTLEKDSREEGSR